MIEVIPNWHPVAVHFTVALLITASVLFAAGTLFRKAASGGALTAAARWNLAIGAAVTVATSPRVGRRTTRSITTRPRTRT